MRRHGYHRQAMAIYLDHAATSAAAPRGARGDAAVPHASTTAIRRACTPRAGAPAKGSTRHASAIAAALGAKPREIVFTGSGTEADNLALKGIAWAASARGRHLDHERRRAQGRAAQPPRARTQNFDVTRLAVDRIGRVDPDEIAAMRSPSARPSSASMSANNEVGTIQPVAEIGDIVPRATASPSTSMRSSPPPSRRPTPTPGRRASSASRPTSSAARRASARSTCAAGRRCCRSSQGGSQERQRRAGTENVAGVGRVRGGHRHRRTPRRLLSGPLRDRLIAGLLAIDGVGAHRPPERAASEQRRVVIEGVEGGDLVAALDLEGIEVSARAAPARPAASIPATSCWRWASSRELAHGSLRLTTRPGDDARRTSSARSRPSRAVRRPPARLGPAVRWSPAREPDRGRHERRRGLVGRGGAPRAGGAATTRSSASGCAPTATCPRATSSAASAARRMPPTTRAASRRCSASRSSSSTSSASSARGSSTPSSTPTSTAPPRTRARPATSTSSSTSSFVAAWPPTEPMRSPPATTPASSTATADGASCARPMPTRTRPTSCGSSTRSSWRGRASRSATLTKPEVRAHGRGPHPADGAEAGVPGDLLRAARRLPRRCSRSGAAMPASRGRSSTPTAPRSARTPATRTTPSASAMASAWPSGRRSTSARCGPSSNTVVIGRRDEVAQRTFSVDGARFTAGEPPRGALRRIGPDPPSGAGRAGRGHDGRPRPVRRRDRRAGLGAGAGPGGRAVRRRRVPRRRAHRPRPQADRRDARRPGCVWVPLLALINLLVFVAIRGRWGRIVLVLGARIDRRRRHRRRGRGAPPGSSVLRIGDMHVLAASIGAQLLMVAVTLLAALGPVRIEDR